jgi:tetratricopeptide (TPR) repeat protein
MYSRLLVALAALVLTPSQANAKWYEAKSRHFIVYSEQSPDELRSYASKLERYDSAIRAVRKMQDPQANTSDRLTVYLVKDARTVAELAGAPGSGILGFWRSNAAGPVAFANSEPKRGKADLDGEAVFFHEYLHHLMLQDAAVAYPTWMSEGYAEFFATAKFHDDGSVEFGAPPEWRGYALAHMEGMPLPEMLGGIYHQTTYQEWVSQYGQGWLLTHYLAFEPSRRGQVDRYVEAIQNGVPALDAAKQAFGDLKELERELDRYHDRKTIPTRIIPARLITVGSVDIRPLSQDEEVVLEIRMKLDAGVNSGQARYLTGGARRAAERYPNSARVLSVLARAEFEAKHYEEALAAARTAAKLDSDWIPALIYEGRAMMKLAEEKLGSADWTAIRRLFSKANHIDPYAPEPLMLYYESFVKQGGTPPRQAVDGLLAALEFSPQDDELRLMAVRRMIKERDLRTAAMLFKPIAYSPHSGKEHRRNLEIMDKMQAADAASALAMLEEDEKKRDRD